MLNRIFDIFITWVFNTLGATIFSIIGGIVITILTAFTDILDKFAPLSYGVSFVITFLCMIVILSVLKSFFGIKSYKKETFIEFDFDGNAMYGEGRENVYGWRWLGPTTQEDGSKECYVVACFDKPISADRVSVSINDAQSTTRMQPSIINFDSRYSLIHLVLKNPGRYKIEYKYHGQS